MAMVLGAFVSKFVDMLVDLAKEEVGMLLGVRGEIKELQSKLRKINKVLADAERKRINDFAIDDWLKELKDFMYDADDILDLSRIEADECSGGSSSFFSRLFRSWIQKPYKMGKRIRELNQRLEKISSCSSNLHLEHTSPDKQQGTYHISRKTSPIVEIDIVGSRIEEDTQRMVDLLIKDDGRRNILVFAIVGAGGIGKTTLARRIYNDQRIQKFSVKKWLFVSQEFDEIKLLKDIIDDAQEQSRSSLEPRVQSNLRGKKLFLVLDDLWTREVWCDLLHNTLNSCATGSRILVTTRNEQVAMQMMAVNIHHVDKLSFEDSWSLLCKKVVLTGEEGEIQHLKDIGMQIVKKCDGLPLAITAIAGVLCTKEKTTRAWNGVLQSTAWSTYGLPKEVKGALYLSYQDLPSYLKQCFIYCSLFPEDFSFSEITQLWIAEEFVKADGSLTVEETAEEYYMELIMRNLLQPVFKDRSRCQMHDILHCLARHLAQDESSVVRNVHEVGSSNGPMKLRRAYVRDSETMKIPDVFVKQNSLRTLIWRDNPMSEMDVVFNKLSRLRVLDISLSKIQRLPKFLVDLIHLRYLNISSTKISVIPEGIGNLRNLQFLDISFTQIIMIPEGIANLRNLQFLTSRSCRSLYCLPNSRAGVDSPKYAFPKLETLEFVDMPNWQEWHWDEGTQAMPCLKHLNLRRCPRLMSLPEGLRLHATSLTTLMIDGASSLRTIERLLSLKALHILGNPNLKKVSDLPALTTLTVDNCPKLQVVKNLPSLKRMELIDYEMKSPPSNLLKGVQRGSKKRKRGHRPTNAMKGIHTSHLEELEIKCNMGLMRKICRREWPTSLDIQQVRVYSEDKSVYAFYNKYPSSFDTNFSTPPAAEVQSSSGLAL